jgi:hypothetical protein
MAEVAGVYDAAPVTRTPEEIISSPAQKRKEKKAQAGKRGKEGKPHEPQARNKWLTASVTDDIPAVIAAAFDEAERRDPGRRRERAVLIDGNNTQIKILHGKASQVAAGIRRRAATYGYSPAERAGAGECARYLDNKKDYLGYAAALEKGWPIATGIIEGACRHLVKDRMDITGARWGLEGAEALLKLRALIASGDFGEYWRFHLRREHERVHHAKYRDDLTLAA